MVLFWRRDETSEDVLIEIDDGAGIARTTVATPVVTPGT